MSGSLTWYSGTISSIGEIDYYSMFLTAGTLTYYVDNTSDVVTGSSSEGTDAVSSSVTFTLGSNVENLTLLGSSAIDGTGNNLANTVTGNSGALGQRLPWDR